MGLYATLKTHPRKSNAICNTTFYQINLHKRKLVAYCELINGSWLNPFKPSVLFVGHRQTAQTQIRRHITWRLIRVSTVCKQKFFYKLNRNEKDHPSNMQMWTDWKDVTDFLSLIIEQQVALNMHMKQLNLSHSCNFYCHLDGHFS